MKAIGVTYKEQEKINFHQGKLYDTLLNYSSLYNEKVDDNNYLCIILKDIKFGYVNYNKSKKRKQLRNLIKNNHINKLKKHGLI